MILMPASTKAGGTAFAMPDVCLTPAPPAPPVPVPYPNTAQLATATGTEQKVLVENMDTVVQGSKMPQSNGDEAGVNGGVTSGTFMGPVEPKLFSSKVFFGGKKAVFVTAMTAHNGTSANLPVGTQVQPSQNKVIVGL